MNEPMQLGPEEGIILTLYCSIKEGMNVQSGIYPE